MLGTSLDSESDKSRQLGCWDGPRLLGPFMKQWATDEPTPDFTLSDAFCDMVISAAFNNHFASEHDFWSAVIKINYQGDEGRRRIHAATVNLIERDSLHSRLPDVQCPVLWIQVCSALTLVMVNGWLLTVVYRDLKTLSILLQMQARRLRFSRGRRMLSLWSWMAVHTSSTAPTLEV